MKGLILAAGYGERLRPLTKSTPKALILINDKPMISYIISGFEKAGIRNLGIVIRRKDEFKFKNALKNYNLNINYIYQKIPLGTANALLQAKEFIGKSQFLLSWCDFLSPFDFRIIINIHLKYKPDATILIKKEEGISLSAQVIFRNSYITKIVEKPKIKISDWVMTGLIVLNSDIFLIVDKIYPSKEREYYLTDVLDTWIHEGKKIRFVKINTWRINVNTFEDIKEAEKIILRQ